MKKYIFIAVSLILITLEGKCQTSISATNQFSNQIKLAANQTLTKLKSKNYVAYAESMYPKLLDFLGGKEKVIAFIENYFGELEKKGTVLNSFTVDNPSKLLKEGDELQCTINVTMEIKRDTTLSKISSIFVCISNNGGKSWYFLDTFGKTKSVMRQYFPNISDNLELQ
ncbi:MAG: hypothetical protein RL708_1751 [Bacteroidota bacterium]|jgi:hypothetical protein